MLIVEGAYRRLAQRLRLRLNSERHHSKPITMKKRYGGENDLSPVPAKAIAAAGGGVRGATAPTGIS